MRRHCSCDDANQRPECRGRVKFTFGKDVLPVRATYLHELSMHSITSRLQGNRAAQAQYWINCEWHGVVDLPPLPSYS